MPRPCGCGSSSVVVQCGTGTTCSGTGTTADPLVISWQIPLGTAACNAIMDCVGANLGAGLGYTAATHTLAARLSSDLGNTLSIGTDGGLKNTGTPDATLVGATVAGLPASNLLASSHGAGWTQWPEGSLRSYEEALRNENISMIRVPCRRTQERMILCAQSRGLDFYGANSATEKTNFVDSKQNINVVVQPSGVPDGSGNYTPTNGYFGQNYPQGLGLPELSDVFRITARRVVLYLQNKDLGSSVSETASPLLTFAAMIGLVQKWGLQKNVIIGTEIPTTASAGDIADLKQGLVNAKAAGIETTIHITSSAQATAHTPAILTTLGVTWVFMTLTVGTGPFTTYKTAGFQVMAFPGNRQWYWRFAQSMLIRGLLSEDPVYAAAETYGYRYRRSNEDPAVIPHTWNSTTQNYGQHAYNDDSISLSHGKYRGYVLSSGILALGTDAAPQQSPVSNYHVLMGEFCPIHDNNPPDVPNPTHYDLDIGVSATQWLGGGNMGMGLFWGNPDDVQLLDINAATTQTKGYCLVLAGDGNFVLRRYDGVAGTVAYVLAWASGFGALAINTEYRMTVQVRPGSIRCGPTSNPTGPNSRLFDATTPAGSRGDLWRGRYFYTSYYRATAGWGAADRVQFHQLKVTVL